MVRVYTGPKAVAQSTAAFESRKQDIIVARTQAIRAAAGDSRAIERLAKSDLRTQASVL